MWQVSASRMVSSMLSTLRQLYLLHVAAFTVSFVPQGTVVLSGTLLTESGTDLERQILTRCISGLVSRVHAFFDSMQPWHIKVSATCSRPQLACCDGNMTTQGVYVSSCERQ